jgi:hypothetical protein
MRGTPQSSDTGTICVWDVIEVKGVVDADGVRECVLGEDFGRYFEKGRGWVGCAK